MKKTGNPHMDIIMFTFQVVSGLFALASVYVDLSHGRKPRSPFAIFQ
jgi:hypothetical protein